MTISMQPTPRLVLASASPRRRALLSLLMTDFDVVPAEIDETARLDESPGALVSRLARSKMQVIAARMPDCCVLGSDTEVVLEDCCLGKPIDPADARRMLTLLSGRTHEVLSAVALGMPDGRVFEAVARSRVRFEPMAEGWIRTYVASGEPMDKAGGYALQGAAAGYIEQVEGSDSAVVGLPLPQTARMLARAGLLGDAPREAAANLAWSGP